MELMKAIRIHNYGGPEVLQHEDAPRPKPAPGEVLIRVHAAGVNPADWKVREGHLKQFVQNNLPLIPGWDVSGVVEEVGAALRPSAEGKQLRFEISLPPDEITLQTDRRALHQILINLANNAVKFTEQGSVRIDLKQHRDDGRMVTEISVTDTGIGIRPEDQVNLFQAFTQIGARRRTEGTGLGLHLSQKMAALLGGQITLQSEPGRGSRFTLVLAEK